MNLNNYQKLAGRTECDQVAARYRINSGEVPSKCLLPTRLLHACIGLSGEVGELAGAIERWIYYGQDLDRTNIKEELGDLLWYVAEMANALELDLDDVAHANIRKLQQRYPEKYSGDRAKEENRDRAKEHNIVAGTAADDGPNYEEDYDTEGTDKRIGKRCFIEGGEESAGAKMEGIIVGADPKPLGRKEGDWLIVAIPGKYSRHVLANEVEIKDA